MNLLRLQRYANRNSYLFALLLLVVVLAINYSLQPSLFELRVLNGNLRNWFPLMLLAAGQTIVIIGGGIDLSAGAMVSMVNALLVGSLLTAESTPDEVLLGALIACGAGMLVGAINGFCVAYLRLQPIVTTYATSFIYAGVALYVLPRPGGAIPADLARTYRSTPLDIPFVVYLIVLLILFWLALRATRFGQYLFATGGQPNAAYASGVPVNFVRFLTYVLSGLFAALAAIALTISVSTGNPRIGDKMTLDSIVAVVVGGTRPNGGQGGIIGTVMGIVILGTIRNIISFANVPTWSQTLVDALIIIAALTGPGLIRLIRRRFQ
nr:MAG: ABC transporter permease [Chloroflexota bacterium]